MKKFIYLFTVGGKIQWSGETGESLPKRASSSMDTAIIDSFIENGDIGEFTVLQTGEYIFRQE